MAKVTFLRHAETKYNVDKIFCGIIDCDITENGKLECKNFLKKHPDFSNFDTIFCSPLKRTQQTLNAIIPNRFFIEDKRIIEIKLGVWEGISKNSIDQNLRIKFKEGKYFPINAESDISVKDRIIGFMNDINNNYSDNTNILVITHNGFLRTFCNIFNLPKISKNLEFFTIDSSIVKNLK